MIRLHLRKLMACFVLAACPLAALESRPVKVSTFHYYRDVKLPPVRGASYGRILLDEAIAMHSYGFDLRMTLDGQPVPHFTRVRESKASMVKGYVRVVHRERSESSVVYVVQIAAAPAGMVPVDLEVTSEANFEAGVRLQSGAKPGEWREAGHFSVYRYDEEPGHLRLPDAGPYYRLEFDGKQSYTFPAVRFAPARTAAEFRITPGTDWKQDYDSDERATVFYYENPSHRKLSRMTLKFKEERFRRPVSFLQFDRVTKSYKPFFSALLFRKDGDAVQSIEFREATRDPVKIVITDGDDAPLRLEEAVFFGPMEELVFQMPDAGARTEASKLRLYYGNKYTSEPDYDVERSFEESLRMVDAEAGAETRNEAFAYSLMEPPVSTWVIRILFLVGLCGIAIPSWKILSRYAERIRPV